jgi:hypothetical protein
MGDWSAVRDTLAALPREEAAIAYTLLLSTLVQDTSAVVLPADVLALADAAPTELGDRQLARLGRLVDRSLEQAAKPGALFAGLKVGTRRLGGREPARRIAAAKVLLAAGLAAEAEAYLPPLDATLKSGDPALINLHARHQFVRGVSESKPESLVRSWTLSLAVLDVTDADDAHRVAARRRALALAPQVPKPLAAKWFRDVLHAEGVAGLSLLGEIAERTAHALRMRHPTPRTQALQMARMVGDELLAAPGGEPGRRSLALAMLSHGWINEAQKAAGGPLRKIVVEDDEKIEALPIPVLLETAPDARWRQSVDADMAAHLEHLTGLLAARAGERERTLAVLSQIAPRDESLARDIAETLVEAEFAAESEDVRAYRMSRSTRMSYSMGSYRSERETTRAGQLRKLAQLTELLALLKTAGVPPLRDAAVVGAFAKCHSPAEVFRQNDIERVFGKADALPPHVAGALATSLRENLAGIWRDPQVQQQTGAGRTPGEQVHEINRGYQLAAAILGSATARAPGDIDLHVLLANVYFDHAEFLYGQQVDLATYARLRDASFKTFQLAAEKSAVALRDTPEIPRVGAFHAWFQAALGASDLAYLTRQDEPDKTQVERIGAALRSLPGETANAHHVLFAEAIVESLGQTPSALKVHVARQAVEILGGHPASKPLVERLHYYDELLAEVELRLAIDGNDQVGARRPFGVHVSLRATQSLMRENEVFRALLISPGGPGVQSSPETPSRQLLENELREKLPERFHVDAIAFHPPTTQTRHDGRDGWLELPLAYLVLRAKDESVDRIPPLQVDLDFADGQEPVRLAVRSQVALIDARTPNPPPRPARDVNVGCLLDGRSLANDKVVLEVTASARGLAPDLGHLLADGGPVVAGFSPPTVKDHGLSVQSLESDSEVNALTERRWTIEYRLAGDEQPATFVFPAVRDESSKVKYLRYADADIVDTDATAPLRYSTLATARRWIWVSLGTVGSLAVAIALAFVYVRRRRARPRAGSAYQWPERLTPFSALSLLRRMREDHQLALTAAEKK